MKLKDHFGWLKSLGMVVNPSKVEFIAFQLTHYKSIWKDSHVVDNCKVLTIKNLKMLGIHLLHMMDWETQVDLA